jgi:hypothetical protein
MNGREYFVGRVVVATASRATKEPTAGRQSEAKSARVVAGQRSVSCIQAPIQDYRRTAFNCIACGGLVPLVEKTSADLATGARLFSILAVQRHDP